MPERIFIHKDGHCIVCVKPMCCRKIFTLENEGLCELVLRTTHGACRKRIEKKQQLIAAIEKIEGSLKDKKAELLDLEYVMFKEKIGGTPQ